MNKIKQRIIDLCMDDNLNGEALVIALEEQIAKILPFNHDAPTDLTSCGIMDGYIKLSLPTNGDSMSKLVEGIESATTKRKLAIAFFHNLVESGHAISIDKAKGSRADILAELLKRGSSKSENPINDLMSNLFSREDSKDKPKDFDGFKDFMKDLLGAISGEDDDSPSPSRCRAEDNSDCWKCKDKNGCTKFTN